MVNMRGTAMPCAWQEKDKKSVHFIWQEKDKNVHLMQRTSSSWPSSVLRQAPHSISHNRIVLSELPDTTSLVTRVMMKFMLDEIDRVVCIE